MAGKSKAKSKGAPAASAASAKDQKSIEKVRDITKRLRKKFDFSDLNKEISAHVAGNPSAVSLLCKAKVDLTYAVDELLRAKVLEDDHGFRVSLPDEQAQRLFSAVENARQGAEQYQSLLCARFYYRLLGVLRPGFEKLHLLEEVDAANDPATELVEQPPLLCDFEKLEDLQKEPRDVKALKVRLMVQMEQARRESERNNKSNPNAADVLDGIFHSGLLYEMHKNNLGQALQRRRNMGQRQLNHHLELAQHLHIGNMGSLDSEDNQKATTEQIKKKQQAKKDADDEIRSKWLEEVVAFVQRVVDEHQDNDSRIAALQSLTNLPLSQLVHELPENLPKDSAHEVRQLVKAMRALVPPEGKVTSSMQVMFREELGGIANVDDSIVSGRASFISESLHAESSERSARDLNNINLDPTKLLIQLWEEDWAMWEGVVPPDMSPLPTLPALVSSLEAVRDQYEPVALDRPPAGLTEVFVSYLVKKAAENGDSISLGDISRVGGQTYMDIMSNKTGKMQTLYELNSACLQDIAAVAADVHSSIDFLWPDMYAVPDPFLSEFQLAASIAEVETFSGKWGEYERLVLMRGQHLVTLSEQLPEAASAEAKMQQVFETYRSALCNDTIPLRLESRLEGRTVEMSEIEAATRPAMPNGHHESGSDSSATEDFSENGLLGWHMWIRPWWEAAEQRFSQEQMQAAALEEIRRALTLLKDVKGLTMGLAVAISSHISMHLHKDASLSGFRHIPHPLCMDHIRVLKFEPLVELLDFLWSQLGLRWTMMPHSQQALQLSVCTTQSMFEILHDGTVRYSAQTLQHIGQKADQVQTAANGNEPAPADAQPDSHQHAAELQPNQYALPYSHPIISSEHVLRCSMFDKPEVNEAYIRQFVEVLFTPPGSYPAEADIDSELEEAAAQELPSNQPLIELRLDQLIHEALAVVTVLGRHCARMAMFDDAVENDPSSFAQAGALDLEKIEQFLGSHAHPAVLQSGGLVAMRKSVFLAKMRQAALELKLDADATAWEVKKQQLKRAEGLQIGIRGFHMDSLQNMGTLGLREIEAIIRREQLHDPGVLQLQKKYDDLARQMAAECDAVKQQWQHSRAANHRAETELGWQPVLRMFLDQTQSMPDAAQDAAGVFLDSYLESKQEAVVLAVDSINRLALHLDMLVLQIKYFGLQQCLGRSENIEQYVMSVHQAVLRKELCQRAQKSKDETQQQVADKTMKELLEADEVSKQTAEGTSKKAKKKKKAAKKGGGDKQEVSSLLQQQDTVPEDWEIDAPEPEVPTSYEEASELPNGVESDSREAAPSTSIAAQGEDLWQRQLRGTVDEDWSTVDKKKDRKGKAALKPVETPPAAGPPGSSWDSPPGDDAEWEAHDTLLDPKPALPSPPPKTEAAASSTQNGQPGPELSTSSADKQEDAQCDKCGKWGHKADACSDMFCDHCGEQGHSIKGCIRFKQEQEASARRRAAFRSRAECHFCHQIGHLKEECPGLVCHLCGQHGHFRSMCPHKERIAAEQAQARLAAVREATTAALSQPEPDQAAPHGQSSMPVQPQAEHSRGRNRGRREGQNEPSAANTLPLIRSVKRGGKDSRQAQAEQPAQDFPSLPGGNKMPPGIPIPPSHEDSPVAMQPPPPPLKQPWGAPRLDPQVSKPDRRSRHPSTQGWGQNESIQEQAEADGGDHDYEEDEEVFHSPLASPYQQSPQREGPHDQMQPETAWGPRGNAVRRLHPSEASSTARGHAALPQHILQPGNGQAGWVPPLPPGPPPPLQLHPRSHDQLASSSDPVISPAFATRSAPLLNRGYGPQSQNPVDPAAPLRVFMRQESQPPQPGPVPQAQAVVAQASVPVASASDAFLEDLLNESRLDNVPVAVAGGASQWPSLGPVPQAPPAALSWASRVENKDKQASETGQEEDDEDLQKALQESLADSQAQEQRHAAYANEMRRHAQSSTPQANGNSIMGLQNMTGEYNCFLNVIIQCLWHCHEFRRQVMGWNPRFYEDNEVVTALMGLFRAFAEKEQSSFPSQAVDPTKLRVALGGLEGNRFAVGEMGDAAEVLTALYEKLATAAERAGQAKLLEQNFGMQIKEYVHCDSCKLNTHQHMYTQYFFNVMSHSIALQQLASETKIAPIGVLLKEIEDQNYKTCDTDKGGCNAQKKVQHHLEGSVPHVFTMQLAWQSNNEKGDDIRQTMNGITEKLDLGDVYEQVPSRQHIYHIRSMVCYYGQHYLAFVLMPDNSWCMFDDASMQRVGTWANVVNKCAVGRTQASVLFFEHM